MVSGFNCAFLVNVLFGVTTETRVSPSWLIGLATFPSIMDMSLPEQDSHGGSEIPDDASIVVNGYWHTHKLYSYLTMYNCLETSRQKVKVKS
jgi:hypothetical protein